MTDDERMIRTFSEIVERHSPWYRTTDPCIGRPCLLCKAVVDSHSEGTADPRVLFGQRTWRRTVRRALSRYVAARLAPKRPSFWMASWNDLPEDD